MEVSLFYGIVDSMNTSVIVEQFVVDSHVVIKEIELSVSGLLHVHLGHPVVGEVQGNVATRETEINTMFIIIKDDIEGIFEVSYIMKVRRYKIIS